jgi:LysR family glycine cleavage system transcriptional activator
MYRPVIDREPPLPPLHSLRAFESAARLLSFTRAAAELHVTQTAVSHHVKQLEAHLGVALFRREPRKLSLTPDGAAWARELGDVFARLRDANRRLRARPAARRPVVAVSVIPSLAARWLVPRLGRFLARNPGVDVHISPSERLVDFGAESIDIGIRYGHGRYPGLVVEKLADAALVVVCAPSLRARRRLSSPEELRRHTLLHDDEPEAWRRWLDQQGVRGLPAFDGNVLTDSSMLVAAAVQGQGVALARWSLAVDDLEAGRLVLPFPGVDPMATGRAYYAAAPREHLARPPVAAFWAWLLEEAAVLRVRPRRRAQPAKR